MTRHWVTDIINANFDITNANFDITSAKEEKEDYRLGALLINGNRPLDSQVGVVVKVLFYPEDKLYILEICWNNSNLENSLYHGSAAYFKEFPLIMKPGVH